MRDFLWDDSVEGFKECLIYWKVVSSKIRRIGGGKYQKEKTFFVRKMAVKVPLGTK